MATGIALSTEELRIARDGSDSPVVDTIPAIAYPLDEDDDASETEELTVEASGTTYVVGAPARDRSTAAGEEPLAIFERGLLSTEPYANPAIEALITDALPDESETRLSYTVPGTIVDADTPTAQHRDAIGEVFRTFDVDATPISTGYAVVADQLADETFTGVGIDIGAELTSVALVYYGVPVLAFALPRGRDWLVENAAGATGHNRSQIASRLEAFSLDPDASGDIDRALAQAYDDLCGSVVSAIRSEAAAADVEPGVSVPVALAGTGAVDGVEYLFGGRFDAAELPFSIRGVRLADDPAASAARGALISAQDDVDDYTAVTWSTHDSAEGDSDRDDKQLTDFVDAEETQESFDTDVSQDDVANDAIERLFDRLGTRDDELAALQETTTSLRDELETVRDDLHSLDAETARTGAVDAVDDRLDEVETALTAVDDAIETCADADRLETIAETVTELSMETDTLSDQLDSLRDEYQRDLDELQSELTTDVADLDAELRARVDELDSEVSTRVDELDSTLADERAAMAEWVDEIEQEREDAVEQLEARISGVDETLSDLDDELSASIDDSFDELESAQTASEERVTNRIDALDSTCVTTQEHVDSLDDAVDALESEFEAVESVLDDTDSTVDSIGSDVESLQSFVESLNEEVESLGSAVEGLESDVGSVDDRVSSLESRFDGELEAIESSVSAAETTVDSLASDVESLESTVAANETAIAEHTGTIATIESTLDEVTSAIEANGERLETLEADSDATDESIETLRQDVDGVEDRLDSIDQSVSELDTMAPESADRAAIDDVEGLAERVSTIAARLDAVESSDSESLDERVDGLESRVETLADNQPDDDPRDRIAELDQAVADLARAVESQSSQATEGDSAPDRRVAASGVGVGAFVAGGASAGVVSGATLTATGAIEIGLGAIALGLVGLVGLFVTR
ncbi:hypothetical protein Halru_1400 [Halovivax ruber XH-70]|uniref:Chromosome segregation ATPase-like protein n=1 Tax=Halovivax ruber (strain DSM 18193 / JCM 13892 / XH-70) TaxID=797302 RepID=L0IB16_HALRX|nr:hypothetical protein [Halovivax ruber]AGB16013.1 hypothetical protein Halru_1400 [Halovivax ruber XH-70]